MSNPHKHQHPEISDEWVERTLLDPYYYEQAPGYSHRYLYYGAVPEMENWLVVVVENNQQVTAYLRHQLRRQWGRPAP